MLYRNNSDNSARFALGDLGSTNLIIFGINPSTATDVVFDSTINRVRGYSRAQGFDGWLMLNLYPQRMTDPRGLHSEVDLALHSENMKQIEEALSQMQDCTLCAAWGNAINERDYLFTCLECINETVGDAHQWYSLGNLTQEGHPRHPLYIPRDTPLRIFDVGTYLSG